MKKFITLCALVVMFYSTALHAQFTDIKGVTIHARTMMYVQDGEIETSTISQIYNISFKDNVLVHNIITDNAVSNSQIYKLQNDSKYMDGDNTIFKFDAVSGVSGLTYYYKVTVDKEGKLVSLVLEDSEGTKTTYTGGITVLKTYNQD